ncbi:hypothetical protein SAVIM40S_04241 [Streptomyces avidinii]
MTPDLDLDSLATALYAVMQTLLDLLHAEPDLVASRPGRTLIADRHYYARTFEHELTEWGVRLVRPARKGEPPTGRIRPVQAATTGHR